jgi:hypothetical protein
MLAKSLLVLTFYPLAFAAQEKNEEVFNEAAFRKSVQEGLKPDPRDRALHFALDHGEVALPILVGQIKEKLNDPGAAYFVRVAADWCVYKPNQRAVDIVADLCQTDLERFSWMVPQVLDRAVGHQCEYELAYYAVERYPKLREPVISWLKDTLKLSMMDERLAKEVLNRERSGRQYWVDDPLLSRLPQGTKEQIIKIIERLRFEAK